MRTIARALLVIFSAGCTTSLTTSPDVFIDSDFNQDESSGIVYALSAWSEKVDGLSFHPRILPHAELLAKVPDANINTIFFLANTNTDRPDECPTTPGVPHGYVGWTYHDTAGNGIVCLNVSDMRRKHHGTDAAWSGGWYEYAKFVAGHELGHAMGLEHVDGVTEIMHPNSEKGPSEPSCSDASQMARAWGITTSRTCEH